MDYSAILDFGDNPVTDVDMKLKILKFDYQWVDAVEEEERRMEKEQKQKREMKEKLDKEIAGEKKDSNTNDNRVATTLDFGDEPVKNWETKLQILKFCYSWADQVEKEEKAVIQEAKAAEERIHKDENENKTKHSSIGGVLTKQQKNSPRMKLAACVRRIKAKELAKPLIEKQSIMKVETAEPTKQKDPRDTKKTLDLGAVGDKKEKSDDNESDVSVKPAVQDGEVCGQSLVGILDTPVLTNPFPNTSVDMSTLCISRISEDKKITSLQEELECIDIHVPEAMELEVNKDQKISLKLLNKDDDSYCDDDDEDDNDDDSLFGPRKLFFFGIDFFKDAGKAVW